MNPRDQKVRNDAFISDEQYRQALRNFAGIHPEVLSGGENGPLQGQASLTGETGSIGHANETGGE